MVWITKPCRRARWRNMKLIVMNMLIGVIWACLCYNTTLYSVTLPFWSDTKLKDVSNTGKSSRPSQAEKLLEKDKNEMLYTNESNNLNQDNKFKKVPRMFLETIVDFYQSLGIEIKSIQNSWAFEKLLLNKNGSIFESTDSYSQESAFITLRYPTYEQKLPNFIESKHREIFLKNELYKSSLGIKNSSYYLNGHLELFRGGRATAKVDCGQRTNISDFRSIFDDIPVLKNKYTIAIGCPLLVPQAYAFQLFMGGVLPKLAQIKPFLDSPEIKFILHHPRDNIIHEILQRIGISNHRIEFVTTYSKINTEYQLNSCITPPTHPVLMQQTRKLLGISETISVAMDRAYIVLLTRKGSHNLGRNIINQEEVTRVLRDRYQERLFTFPGPMGLNESIAIFGRARLIIGVHGGALYNLYFAPKDATIVEYLGMRHDGTVESRVAHAIIWILSQSAGQSYYRVIEEPLNRILNIKINIETLVRLLEEIDKKQLFY